MQPKFRELIKPGTTFPWMANSKKLISASVLVLAASVISLLIRGLDLGIDFKGGTKLIVGFTDESGATPEKIREVVAGLIKEKTGSDAGQVEVQGFNVGDTDAQGRKVQKFQIYTELTTLLTEAKATEVSTKVTAALGGARVDRPAETDKFIVTLLAPAPVNATKDKLSATLKELGFTRAEVLSEEERAYDMDFFKEYNLTYAERAQAGETIADDDYDRAYADHDKRKRTALETRVDRVYTLSLQQIQADVEQALVAAFPNGADGKPTASVESATAVSASVGADLFAKGMLALVYAILGVVVYVGLRFDFRYGPGAIVALIHDAVITLGVFSVFGIKFTLPIVSAVLTIIGYSINDTIVVYDRIRENQDKLKGMSFSDIIDLSINETLSRTLLTSLCTLMITIALIFLGGGLISDFALALTVGIVVGTYSSIAIASPFTIFIEDWLAARRGRALGKNTPQAQSPA